jgi:pimeloyl-ACP methyl ester carboxylesterase
MRDGYAIVASDYAGLGTRGLPAYLNGRSEAHNIVDIVKAGRAYARDHLAASSRLARKWVVIGQSQGAGAAIYTARHATRYGGRGLDYRGAVGTGTPAYIEDIVKALGPGFPDVSPATTLYFAYTLASVRHVYPNLGVNGVLSATGRRFLRLGETQCVFEFERNLEQVEIGDFFTGSVSELRGFSRIIESYMAMPEQGFDKPFFMGHGRNDADVPYEITLPYVEKLRENDEPLTFKTYDSDHSGTLLLSQKDTHPFVRRLFAER